MAPAEQRFIEAFELLRSSGKLNQSEFCRELGISKGTFGTWKSGTTNRHAKVEWFTALAEHGISSEWLLLGTGPMLTQTIAI